MPGKHVRLCLWVVHVLAREHDHVDTPVNSSFSGKFESPLLLASRCLCVKAQLQVCSTLWGTVEVGESFRGENPTDLSLLSVSCAVELPGCSAGCHGNPALARRSRQQCAVRERNQATSCTSCLVEPGKCCATHSDSATGRLPERASQAEPCVPPRCPTPGTPTVPLVRLVRSLRAWLVLPSPSRWLIRTIRLGYAIQFARRPRKFRVIHSTTVRAADAHVLCAEIAVLLAKDVIEPVPPADMRSGHYSPYFIVPKKGGRSVLAFEGRAYQYKVLPFGLSLSTRVFTKVTEGALVPMREQGVRILNCLDDWLILAHSRDQLCEHRDLVLRHLSQLGLQVNREKSKLAPVQRISFLGMELDSVTQTERLTEQRAQLVLNCLNTFKGRTAVPLKFFQRLLGHMAAAVTPLGLLHMRPLQHWLFGRVPRWAWHHGTHRVTITPECRQSFSPWSDPSFLRAGVPLEQVSRHAVVSQMPLPPAGVPRRLTLSRFKKPLQGRDVLVRTDNTVTVAYINRQGCLRSRLMSQLARHLLLESEASEVASSHTLLLIALASNKRVGDLQAFSVDESCLEFGPDDNHVVLRPRPGYVPKVPTTPFRDQVVNLQALPLEEADPALALLCPVRALRMYVDRTRSIRTSDQLLSVTEASRRERLSPSRGWPTG
ncbi:hypothetical protein PO909_007437 [Leuciscus waleckii]